jgi:hypothetical protein
MIELNFDEFFKEVKDVFDNPRPWMHTRYGDGEGIVMGFPEFTSEQKARQRWKKWLGHFDIDLKEFSSLIRESVRCADVVGTPCKRHASHDQNWHNVMKFMDRLNLISKEQKTCCMDFTIMFQTQDLYKELFENVKQIFYISCRNVSNQLKTKFNFEEVYGVHLPPQHIPCVGPVLTNEKHYPHIYEKIDYMCNNHFVDKNSIWLVGAGGLGKIYCMKIKEAGGIALDVGSIFDGWAGLQTRSYLRDGNNYSL